MGTYQVQLPRQVRSAAIRALVSICLVRLEEVLLRLERILNWLPVLNISLAAVDNGNVTKPQRDDSSGQNIHNVGPLVHEIHLREDANGALSFRVNLSRQL